MLATALVLAALAPCSGPVFPAVAAGRTEQLLRDLKIVPLEPTTPPAFVGRDLAGGPVELAQFEGRPVLLYFWATW